MRRCLADLLGALLLGVLLALLVALYAGPFLWVLGRIPLPAPPDHLFP